MTHMPAHVPHARMKMRTAQEIFLWEGYVICSTHDSALCDSFAPVLRPNTGPTTGMVNGRLDALSPTPLPMHQHTHPSTSPLSGLAEAAGHAWHDLPHISSWRQQVQLVRATAVVTLTVTLGE